MRRVIIAITGASGVIYGIRALELLRAVDDVETNAIITTSAFRTALAEVDYEPDQIKALADRKVVTNFVPFVWSRIRAVPKVLDRFCRS